MNRLSLFGEFLSLVPAAEISQLKDDCYSPVMLGR